MNNDKVLKEVVVKLQLKEGSFIDKNGKLVNYTYVYCPAILGKLKFTALELNNLGLVVDTNK